MPPQHLVLTPVCAPLCVRWSSRRAAASGQYGRRVCAAPQPRRVEEGAGHEALEGEEEAVGSAVAKPGDVGERNLQAAHLQGRQSEADVPPLVRAGTKERRLTARGGVSPPLRRDALGRAISGCPMATIKTNWTLNLAMRHNAWRSSWPGAVCAAAGRRRRLSNGAW